MPSIRRSSGRLASSTATAGVAGGIPARLFDARETREPGPVVLFFHGGGFVIGDVDTHASFCAEMARTLNLPVVSVDYRLAPENRWPAAPDDCEAAARWVAESPPELGRKVTSIVLSGDSAGGNLSADAAVGATVSSVTASGAPAGPRLPAASVTAAV